jgi:predicted small integral membrane protein
VTPTAWRKFVAISLPAMFAALLVLLAGLELWTRARWNPRMGRPGFFLSDAMRGQRLAAGYVGWFAGVPVQINSLELRDSREYQLAKRPNTFRILVLGDSVTFGHGSLSEHTYPYLTEQALKAWRPDIDWQVWNAAVPGYNTSQELAHLLEVGDRFRPDLVVVGFFENDLVANSPPQNPGRLRLLATRAASIARQHLYSLELYKKAYLTLAWRLSGSDEYRRRVEHLGTEEGLLATAADVSALREQQLTPVDRLSDDEVRRVNCIYGMKPNPALIGAIEHSADYAGWLDAVRGFQRLNASGAYRVVFFVNDVPPICPDGDVFYDGGSKAIDEFYLSVMGNGTPAVSVYDAFLHMRPSQMPNARAHAIGNSNLVKAGVLFEFLKANPALIERTAAAQFGHL